MERNELVVALANRMNADETAADQWLEATLDVINGVLKPAARSGPAAALAAVAPMQAPAPAVAVKPLLRPATATTRLSIDQSEIVMNEFPFRIGREARMTLMSKLPLFGERRSVFNAPNNELYVRDMGRPLHVSREHLQIERNPDGTYDVVDRGSACGTIVNGMVIGGEYTGGRCALFDGDTIVVGGADSAIAFEFIESPQ